MARITIRRGASALGASALIALALAGPASARIDPGDRAPASSGSGITAGDVRHHDSVASQGLSSTELRQLQRHYGYPASPEAPQPPAKIVTVDSNTVEYLQVGAGALAGMALTGAGALVLSQVNRRKTAAV